MDSDKKPDEMIVAGEITFDANVIAAILENYGAPRRTAALCAAEILQYLKETCSRSAIKGTLQ